LFEQIVNIASEELADICVSIDLSRATAELRAMHKMLGRIGRSASNWTDARPG
jgi:hypothetical protein